MKKILLLLLLILPFNIIAQEEGKVIKIDGQEYNIIIPEDLRTAYIDAMTSYLGEMVDYEKLSDAFDQYKISAEKSIESKNSIITTQEKLLKVKDTKTKELKRGRFFSIIPSIYYTKGIDYNGFGAGAGILLFDSFYAGLQVGYPLEATISVGWKF